MVLSPFVKVIVLALIDADTTPNNGKEDVVAKEELIAKEALLAYEALVTVPITFEAVTKLAVKAVLTKLAVTALDAVATKEAVNAYEEVKAVSANAA